MARGRRVQFVTIKYQFDPNHQRSWKYLSTEQAFAAVAIALSVPSSKTGEFDIRALGALHAALYLLSFYLLQPLLRGLRPLSRAVAYGLIIAVFGDVMYVSWLNSVYSDISALLFLMLAMVLYLRSFCWTQAADRIGFVVAVIFFTASKSAHSFLVLPVAGLILSSGRALGDGIFRVAAAGLFVVTMVVTSSMGPPDYAPGMRYDVIFYELLPHSKDPHTHLRELGLDDSYARGIGTISYSDDGPYHDPQVQRDFAARTSHARLVWFLLRHPSLAYGAIHQSMDYAGRQRPAMGNFPRSAGLPESAESHTFSFWSGFKQRVFENRGTGYLLYSLGLFGILIAALRWRDPDLQPAGVCLCLMALLAMCIGSFGDAVETTRHFFLFNALLDLILVSAVVTFLLPKRQFAARQGSGWS